MAPALVWPITVCHLEYFEVFLTSLPTYRLVSLKFTHHTATKAIILKPRFDHADSRLRIAKVSL